MEYRDQILNGNLTLPGASTIEAKLGEDTLAKAESLWSALWHNFLNHESPINSTYWYEQWDDPKSFNLIIMSLCKSGWLISTAIPERNWAEMQLNRDHLLSFVTESELLEVRSQYKFQQYRPRATRSTKSDLVRLNGKLDRTGLVRTGFMKAGNTRYSYDLDILVKYQEAIQLNLTKSMSKIRDMHPQMKASIADYDEISVDILNYLVGEQPTMTRGNCVADSRGRAISSSLSKVANPISCKDFRALLTMEQ